MTDAKPAAPSAGEEHDIEILPGMPPVVPGAYHPPFKPTPKPEGRSCEWTDLGEMWQGTCGITWSLEYDGLVKNEMHYCPKCGKPIHETPAASDGEGEA
jgi:hypothetical protein